MPRQEGWPVAAPYFGLLPDGIKRVYLEKQDNTMQAGGGTLSTAADLARWIEVQLNDGRLDGRQVFPEAVIRATHQRHAETDAEFGPFKQGGYGLGWYVASYQDEPMLHHFGSFAGAGAGDEEAHAGTFGGGCALCGEPFALRAI